MAETKDQARAKQSPIKSLEQRLDQAWGYDLETPAGRRRARWHFNWIDHGILRAFWTNLFEIAPNVWRSNHPSRKRIQKYKRMGITDIINLRGQSERSHHVFEREACEELGLNLHNVRLAARNLVAKEHYLALLDLFDTIDRPFVMHCKSGADRAGLASAMYLIHKCGAPVSEAKKQFSFRYLHIKFIKTGILDHLLEKFEAAHNASGVTLRDWFKTEFDPVALTEEFQQKRAKY